MIRKIRAFIYFFVFFLVSFIHLNAQDFSSEKEIDFDIDWIEEDEKFQDKKTLYIKHADQIQTTQDRDKAGYSHSRLSGNVFIVFEEKKIYADLMIIKLFDEKAEEIIATGNVLIESDKSITIGEKFFFYPNKKKGVIYQAETYNKPYFIRGEYFKFSGEEKMIGNNMTFSTCEDPMPHYSIGAVKGWIYKNEQDFFLGFSIRAGEDPIFFFPFMHRSYYGTGLITSLGKEEGSGWFVNNTYKNNGNGYTFKLMIDHYQKTGEYFGVEYTRNEAKIGNFTFKEAVIYDKHVKYDGKNFTNFFEQEPGQPATSGRSLRYKTDNTYNFNFLKLTDFSSTLNLHYYSHSDPFIASQYESRRMETFDAKKILFPEQGPASLAGSFSSGTGTGKVMDFYLNNTIYGTTLNISGNWNYTMYKTDDTSFDKNPYRPEYYKNYKSLVIWPFVTVKRTFNLFDPLNLFKEQPQQPSDQPGTQGQIQGQQGQTQPQSQGQQTQSQTQGQGQQNPQTQAQQAVFTWPWSLETGVTYKETINYNLDRETSKVIESTVELSLKFPFTYNLLPFSISAPFEIKNNNVFRQDIGYTYDSTLDVNPKTSDVHNTSYDFTFMHPLNVEIKGTNSVFTWSLPLSTVYHYQKKRTDYPVNSFSEADRINTYKMVTYNLSNEIKYTMFTDYEYLETSIQAKIGNVRSKKTLDNALNPSENQKGITYNYSASLSTMKSSISIDTSDNFSDGVLEENRNNPWNITLETKLIPNITLRDSYVYKRYYKAGEEKAKSNTLNIAISVPSKLNLTSNFWLNSLTWNVNWYRDYVDFFNDKLDYSLSANFNYTKLWQFKIAAGGQNSKLYQYTNKYERTYGNGNPKRDIWDDLYKSMKIWGSTKERQDTLFKMSSFGMEIIHDLHKWNASLSSTFTPKTDRNGGLYFESLFLFTLTITDFSGFMTPPSIQKKFGGPTN